MRSACVYVRACLEAVLWTGASACILFARGRLSEATTLFFIVFSLFFVLFPIALTVKRKRRSGWIIQKPSLSHVTALSPLLISGGRSHAAQVRRVSDAQPTVVYLTLGYRGRRVGGN